MTFWVSFLIAVARAVKKPSFRFLFMYYTDMWNVHRMFITYIHKTKESRNTKKTNDFFFQVRNFLLPLSLKVLRHKEKDIHSFYSGFSVCPPPTKRVEPATRPQRASESQTSSPEPGTLLKWLFSKSPKSSTHSSRAWRHSHPQVNLSFWDFYFDICERHIHSARVNTCAQICT